MQNKIDEIITHMSHSHQQMARVLEAERHMAVRMSQIIHDLPDSDLEFDGVSGIIESSGQINKNIVAYLGGDRRSGGSARGNSESCCERAWNQ